MKNLFGALSFLVLFVSCTGKKTDEIAVRFLRATMVEFPGETPPLVDTMFHQAVPVYPNQEEQFVYVANPECSFCIATAIDCCNAWALTGLDSPFVFLIKSDYTDLFEFYMERDCQKKVAIFTSRECEGYHDGLYTIKDGHVISFSTWDY